jgi:hypothetical protein
MRFRNGVVFTFVRVGGASCQHQHNRMIAMQLVDEGIYIWKVGNIVKAQKATGTDDSGYLCVSFSWTPGWYIIDRRKISIIDIRCQLRLIDGMASRR